MKSRHAEVVAALEAAIMVSPGVTTPAERSAVAEGEAPAALASYIEKVRRHAYKVTDEDVAALRKAGYSEEQLFELTIAAAWGAARKRLRAGMAALKGAG